MNKIKKIIAVGISVIVIFSVVGIFLGKLLETPQLTEEEVKERVEKIYSGKMKNIIQKDKGYTIIFEKDSGIYEVFINNENGKFSGLTLLKEKESIQTNNLTKDENKANVDMNTDVKEPPSKQKLVILSEEQIKSIALKKFSGVVEDIDYVNGEDGGYYLVEIEKDEEEIEIQIHAVTGKILSVKYDD